MKARRTPVIDEYVEDGESAVFVSGKVIALSVLPTRVLAGLSEEWRDLAELEPLLVAAFGAPDDGTVAQALTEVVETLAGHDLVELQPDGTTTLPA